NPCWKPRAADQLFLRPHRQFVTARIGEMKAAAAGKRKGILSDSAASVFHFLFNPCEIGSVKHDQNPAPHHLALLGKAAGDTAILKAGVVRTVVGELPSESLHVEGLGLCHVNGGKLDVVDAAVARFIVHCFWLLLCECSCYEEYRDEEFVHGSVLGSGGNRRAF